MAFALLTALTVVLFARPGELLPILLPLHPYEVTIVSCTILGYDRVIDTISGRSLSTNRIVTCIIGLFSWTVLDELCRVRLDSAYEAAEDLLKILIYVFLLVGLVDRPSRVRTILIALVASGIINISCAILNFYDYARFEYMIVIEEVSYIADEAHWVRRLGASTIFGDPNDLALFISQCIIICLFLLWDHRGSFFLRGFWLLPMGFLFYALNLTQSRGGLVSLMAGLVALAVGRLGRKAVLILAPAIPVLLTIFAGRQATIDLGGGSGQSRVQLWIQYLEMLWAHPLLGVGWKQGPTFCSFQAHNSYLQAFGEQGYPAGVLFLGAHVLAVWALTRPVADPAWARIRPCLLGLLASQMVGMMGLTRNLAVPTFTVVGLAAAYLRSSGVAPLMPRGGKLVRLLIFASIGFLAFMWTLTRVSRQA